MQTAGIIRRVDDLGRIVIPKEIRNKLKIKKGECLEIFIDKNKIILDKYNIFNSELDSLESIIEIISKILNINILITDSYKVLYAKGKNSGEFIEEEINNIIYETIEERNKVINYDKTKSIFNGYYNYIILPLILNGDAIGSIIFIKEKKVFTKEELLCLEIIEKLLINNLEV